MIRSLRTVYLDSNKGYVVGKYAKYTQSYIKYKYMDWCHHNKLPQVYVSTRSNDWFDIHFELYPGGYIHPDKYGDVYRITLSYVLLFISYIRSKGHMEWNYTIAEDYIDIDNVPRLYLDKFISDMLDVILSSLSDNLPEDYKKTMSTIKDQVESEYDSRFRLIQSEYESRYTREEIAMRKWSNIKNRKRYFNIFSHSDLMYIIREVGLDSYNETLNELATKSGKYSNIQDIEYVLEGIEP